VYAKVEIDLLSWKLNINLMQNEKRQRNAIESSNIF